MEAPQPPRKPPIMEMDAATTRGKKRQSVAPKAKETPLPPTAMDKRSTHSQEPEEPPPAHGAGGGEGGGAGVDRISDLPDGILCSIVSLLPTMDGALTQTLARRWRNVWRAAPLNLDYVDLPADDEALAGVVTRILLDHPGPCRRFCIQPDHLYDRPLAVDAWLQCPSLDNLQELEFWEARVRPSCVRMLWMAKPPTSAFRFSATLRVASFCKCNLRDTPIDALHFPQLRQLGLQEVYVPEGSLHTLISSCPVLECLLLNRNDGFHRVRINSKTLRSIGVGAKCFGAAQFRKLIIEDAPCLERLLTLQLGLGLCVSVISAPKLEALSSLNGLSRYVFGGTAIQGVRVDSLTAVVCSVKILAINRQLISLDTVIDLMECFPCLEKLYIKGCQSNQMNRWRRKHKHLIECLNIRLKTIVLEPYSGFDSEVNFASFFVLNARDLEVMRLGVGSIDYHARFIAKQHKVLEMEKRASRGARLEFALEICPHDFLHINHVRDLSIANPFECRG